ncbi:MAG TPA: pseudoazurin [Sphingomicrobium sp.]|nr:pseudoazurin [Sphingomicrobium sp.]
MSKRLFDAFIILAFGMLGAASPAAAAEVQIKMLNQGPGGMMVFEPAFVRIKPGDSVKFIAADKGHNAVSLPGMLPPGTAGFSGAINQEIELKLTKPGLYAYHCVPHTGLGMVGLIEVGNASNKSSLAAAAEKLPGLAKKRMAELLGQAK